MTAPTIVLHQWQISPYCGKVRKILAFKGLPYRIEEYAGLRGIKVKALSKAGKLPVLDYNGERFQDSSVIAQLLEERHPKPSLWPAGDARYIAHLLEDWADESLYWFEIWARFCNPVSKQRAVALLCEGRPVVERVLVSAVVSSYTKRLRTQGLGLRSDEAIQVALHEHLAALEGRLDLHEWLAGDRASIADIAVSAQLDELQRTTVLPNVFGNYPHLRDWLTRCDFSERTQPLSVTAP